AGQPFLRTKVRKMNQIEQCWSIAAISRPAGVAPPEGGTPSRLRSTAKRSSGPLQRTGYVGRICNPSYVTGALQWITRSWQVSYTQGSGLRRVWARSRLGRAACHPIQVHILDHAYQGCLIERGDFHDRL